MSFANQSNACKEMFKNCSNLNNINVMFTRWDFVGGTENWVLGVASTGTFTCPTELPEEFGPYRIPAGWTIVRK
jgi:hypothetical protein